MGMNHRACVAWAIAPANDMGLQDCVDYRMTPA